MDEAAQTDIEPAKRPVGRPAGSAIAHQHRDEILQRIATGEQLTKIATDLGYSSHQGIDERLGDDPDYRRAMKASFVGKIEKRETDLERADNNVAVTRADRLLGHARWWAERLDPDRFGIKKDQQPIAIQVVINKLTE